MAYDNTGEFPANTDQFEEIFTQIHLNYDSAKVAPADLVNESIRVNAEKARVEEDRNRRTASYAIGWLGAALLSTAAGLHFMPAEATQDIAVVPGIVGAGYMLDGLVTHPRVQRVAGWIAAAIKPKSLASDQNNWLPFKQFDPKDPSYGS